MKPLTLADIDPLYTAICETLDSLHLWMDWATLPFYRADAECRIASHLLRFKNELSHAKPYGIFLKDKETLIGEISIHHINIENRSAQLGYWMRKNYQLKGLMLEAVTTITEYIFNNQLIDSVYIYCEKGNEASMRVALRSGFVLNDVLKNGTINLITGMPNDVYIYSKNRKQFEKRLD